MQHRLKLYDPDLHPDFQPHTKPAMDVFIDAVTDLENPQPGIHLKSFPEFNRMAGGFRPHEFSILCGGTGVGKTTLLAAWSADLIETGVSHFVASVETGPTDYAKRIMSAWSGFNLNASDDPMPRATSERILSSRILKIQKAKFELSLHEDRFDVSELILELSYQHKVNDVKIAFIDNLNFFLDVTAANMAIVEMDRVIHDLIIFSKMVPMHIVMVMHPKKTGGRVESEFDIKGSSTAVQEAHNVFLFNREGGDDHANSERVPPGADRSLKIAKSRRRGIHAGKSMYYQTLNGVKYIETTWKGIGI